MSICSCNQKDNIINEANIEHIDMFDISCDNNIFEIDSIFIEQGYNDDSFKDFKKDTVFYYIANYSDCIYKEQSSKCIRTTPKSRKVYFYEISFKGDSIVKTIYDKYYKLYGNPTEISYNNSYDSNYEQIPIDTIALKYGVSPNTIDIDSIIIIAQAIDEEALGSANVKILWENNKGNVELTYSPGKYINEEQYLSITDKYNQSLNIQEQKELYTERIITTAIILIIVIFFIIILFIRLRKISRIRAKENEELFKAELLKLEAEKDIEIKAKEEYENKVKSFERNYGTLTKEIRYRNILNGYNNSKINDTIYIFESTSTIMINNQVLKFKDILGFNVFDNSTVIYSGQTAVTKSKTGSSLGRAVVGGALLGGVGAIIGGTTGKKETVLSAQTSSVNHSYTIVININDLSTPLIKLTLGDSQGLVQMISSILTIICERNKTSD